MPETRALKVSALALAQAGPRSIPRRRDGGSRSLPRIVTSSATNPRCAGMIFWSATRTENHSARSTSGNCCCFPDFGGHSRENTLLCSCVGSQSPSTAQAWTTLPLRCVIGISGMNGPWARQPVSSSNSRCAAASGASPLGNSPLGIDHAPSSSFAQNGPPGCTSSSSGSPVLRRTIRRPALVFTISSLLGPTSATPPHVMIVLDAVLVALEPRRGVEPRHPHIERRLAGIMIGIGGAELGMLEHRGIELDHVDVVWRDLLRHAHQSSSRWLPGG